VSAARERLGISLVGAGRMGRTHLRALDRAQRVVLRAICDPAVEAADAAEQAGVPWDAELAVTLAREDVSAVLVAAPTPLHEQVVAASLEAGRHVLCEKPLTFDAAADARLDQLAQDRGLVLQVGFWRRRAWPYREARRLIAEGAIGEPRLLRLCQWDASPPPASFCDPAVSGGLEVDCGVHEADLAAWLCDAQAVEAFGRGAPTRAELAETGDVESAGGVLVLAGGQVVTIDLARTCAFADVVRSEIVGEHGALLCEAHGAGSLQVGDADGLRAVEPPTDDVLLDALALQLDGLASAVAGEATPDAASADQASAALRAARALRRSRLSRAAERI
jgi:myo-inositol 2-dehydrogenase/D-chiro-inositol 1-dehydrogenase